ncbi:MAG TPA: hypothetical protein VG055_08855 [Planctomycetaceae bacterium]|nr:hypothetical protein [Planctomycetaceae bacterium]
MSSTLDESRDDTIQTTGDWPEGLDFKFPRRDLGRGRFVLLVLSLGLGAMISWLVAGPIWRLVQGGVTFGGILSLVVGLVVGAPLCRYPLWYLAAFVFGRREIGLRSDWLYVGERVGWLRQSKRWPLGRIKRIQIVDLLPDSTPANRLRAKMSSTPDTSGAALARHLHVLTGVLDDGKRIVLAPFYPRELLDRFAADLTQQIALAARDDDDLEPASSIREGEAPAEPFSSPSSTTPAARSPIEAAPAIGVSQVVAEVQEKMRKAREPDVLEQPPGSKVQLERFPDGITFRVPPAGVWKGSAGMFQFGILWTFVIAGFTVLFAGAGVAKGQGVSAVLGALGIMSLFWLVGAGLLLGGWVMGTRESVIAVVGDSVMVMQTGLRRSKRREWPRSAIKTARVGASGTEVNDEPVLELQLHGPDKKLFGMLAGRDVQELTWMATLLRQALKGTEPGCPEKSSAVQSTPSDSEQTAPTHSAADFSYEGMTIDERLKVAQLSDQFAAAVERSDREAMLQILQSVQLPPAGAAAYAEAVLANPGARDTK